MYVVIEKYTDESEYTRLFGSLEKVNSYLKDLAEHFELYPRDCPEGKIKVLRAETIYPFRKLHPYMKKVGDTAKPHQKLEARDTKASLVCIEGLEK